MKMTFKVDNLKNMSAELRSFADLLRDNQVGDEDVFLSRLVSCELITNVIRHGGDEATFCGKLSDDLIEITVSADSLRGLDVQPKLSDVFAEGGRGLYIVKSVCYGDIERGENGEFIVYIKRKN